jgi:tripartite-type tricarboxylate transporter receptor subunit TctC
MTDRGCRFLEAARCGTMAVLIALAAPDIAWAAPAVGPDAFPGKQDAFKGKTVTVYVAAPVGGGYDLYGRLLARHLGRHLPGQPNVVVSNMPGGSGINAANFLYGAAPKDGTAIAILIQTMGEEQGLKNEAVRFDIAKFNWVGRVTSNIEITYIWHAAPVKSVEDATRRETLLAAAGPSSILFPLLLNEMAGTRFKLIRGYQGTQNAHLAMQRGEVEGNTSSLDIFSASTNWLQSGEAKIIVQHNGKRHARLPDVPAVMEFAKTEDDKQLLSFIVRSSELGRAFVAPPYMPSGTMQVLRRAFDATMQDQDFRADQKKVGADFDPSPGEALQQLFAGGVELSEVSRERVKALRRVQ